MIVAARTDGERLLMLEFLHRHGVLVPRSEDFQALGRMDSSGKLIGVVGYNGFCGQVCSLHDAGEGNWLSREYLRAIFDYPFRQMGCVQIFAYVRATNERALRLNRRVGFTDFARIKDGWKQGDDLVILAMKQSECRWLTKPDERKAA